MMRSAILCLMAILGLVLLTVPEHTNALRWREDDGVIRALDVVSAPPVSKHELDIIGAELDTNNKVLNAIQFFFSTNWVPRFVLRLFHASEQEAAFLSGRWVLWKLVEYEESANGTDGYEPGVDTLISEKHLWDTTWDDMTLNETDFANGGKLISVCAAYTPGNFAPLEVDLCTYLANRKATDPASGNDLSPNALKWSLNIQNYPYQSNSSRLALKVSFDSNYITRDLDSSEVENHANPLEEAATELGADSSGAVLDVAWTRTVDLQPAATCGSTAQINRGVIHQGQLSVDNDDLPNGDPEAADAWTRTVRVSYFSFLTPSGCQATSIYWDPEMGGSSTTGAGSVVAPSMLMLLVVALLMFLLN